MMLHEAFIDLSGEEKLLFRDEQFKIIENTFKCYENKDDPSAFNLLLIGVTGAGKTLTLNRVLAKYPNHKYISAATQKRTNQILSLISGVDVRRADIILNEAVASLKNNNQVLVIDELNRLEDPKEFFGDLNTIFRETHVPIILVTNNPFITQSMEEDARNTLFLESVVFTRYGLGELREICLQRIGLLSIELQNKMEEGTLNYICTAAAKLGSARRALDRVRRCYQQREFDVNSAMNMDKNQECLNLPTFINSMNETEKNFLAQIKFIYEDKIAQGQEFFTSKDIQYELKDMHRSKIAQLITLFEDKYNFIKTEYSSLGKKGGRYRKIFFTEEVWKKLNQENLL